MFRSTRITDPQNYLVFTDTGLELYRVFGKCIGKIGHHPGQFPHWSGETANAKAAQSYVRVFVRVGVGAMPYKGDRQTLSSPTHVVINPHYFSPCLMIT